MDMMHFNLGRNLLNNKKNSTYSSVHWIVFSIIHVCDGDTYRMISKLDIG